MTPDRVLTIVTQLATEPGAPKTIDPNAVARELAGSDSKVWGRMSKQLRPMLIKLAESGAIELIRKGQVIEPGLLRGVYRLRLPEPAE